MFLRVSLRTLGPQTDSPLAPDHTHCVGGLSPLPFSQSS